MKVLVDMNLSPRWVDLLTGEGVEAAHLVNPWIRKRVGQSYHGVRQNQ